MQAATDRLVGCRDLTPRGHFDVATPILSAFSSAPSVDRQIDGTADSAVLIRLQSRAPSTASLLERSLGTMESIGLQAV
jgi:hypothetical protein